MLDLGDQFFNNTKDKIFIKVSSLLYCAVVEKVNNYSDLDLLFWNWTLTFLKSLFYLLQWKAFKKDEKASYFILKAVSVLKIFNFLFFFGHVGKRLDKKAQVDFKIYDVTVWETQLQYTYCPMSEGVKAIKKWNLVGKKNITWDKFLF